MALGGNASTVGVDVSKRSIKIAAVRPGRKPILLFATVFATPDGAIEGGMVVAPHAVVQAIRQVISAAKLRGSRAVIGMGGRNVLIRNLTFPPMPAEELKAAVKWEAERHLPLRIEDAVVDAQVVREVKTGPQRHLDVLMAAVPEREALAYYQIMTQAGLEVVAIEATALALARTLGETPQPTAAIDVGAENTELVIVQNSLPLICRSIPVGSMHLTESAPDDAVAAAADDAPTLQNLLVGLSRSVDYFQAQTQGQSVARAVLSGDGALRPGLAEMIAAELGVPTELGAPLSMFTHGRGIAQELLDHDAPLAVAAGLALRKVA